MNKQLDLAVVIGRFNPPHLQHFKLVETALGTAKQVLLIIGDHKKARDHKNPFTAEQRKSFFQLEFPREIESGKVQVRFCRNFQSDNLWVTEIQKLVDEVAEDGANIGLVGNEKDPSSFYLNLFPDWVRVGTQLVPGYDASEIRERLYTIYEAKGNPDILVENKKRIQRLIGTNATYLESLLKYLETDPVRKAADEFLYLREYVKKWEKVPFKPVFTTTDAVVICLGHILVVRRKGKHGNGLLALPGGFLGQNDTLFESCIRELYEETKIDVSKGKLIGCFKDKQEFDQPNRSLRGRTITFAYFFDISPVCRALPKVKGSDDAEKAMWLSFADAYSQMDEFFEDHFSIIERFINRV